MTTVLAPAQLLDMAQTMRVHYIRWSAAAAIRAQMIPWNLIPDSEVERIMDFFDALVRYEINLWSHADRKLRGLGGPSLAVLSALRVLKRHSPSSRVQELRRELRITVGAASKLADRLEKEGFIQRQPHPSDRRSSLLALTPAGEQALAMGARVLQDILNDHLAGEDISQLVAVIQRLDVRLSAAEVALR